MANISVLNKFISGVSRGVDLTSSTLVLENFTINLGTAFTVTFSGTPTADRTITMPDTNVDLGQIATNKTHVDGDGSDHADVADLTTLSGSAANSTNHGAFTGATLSDTETTRSGLQALETEVETKADSSTVTEIDQNVDDLVTLSGSSENSTNHGAFTGATLSDTETTRSALQALETLSEANSALSAALEWQNSAKDLVADNTLVPVTEVSGDRYVLSFGGGAPNAAWDGASAGDIVEFDGTIWVATTPTLGMVISIDDETTSLRQFGGATWDQKFFESTTASVGLTKVGFDIRLADAAENASGIQVSSGAITLNDLGAFDTADLAEDPSATVSSGTMYYTDARVRAALLTGFTSGAGTVAATDTLLEAIQKIDGNNIATQSDLDAVEDNTITSTDGSISVAGTIGGDDQVVETVFSTAGVANRSIDAADLASNSNGIGASMIGIEDSAGNVTATTVEGAIAELAAAAADTEALSEDMVAGETLTAGVRFLRMGKTADGGTFTDRVYLASDAAASTDDFYSIGIAVCAGEIAAAAINGVVKAGKMTATAHGLTIGEPFFLSGTSGSLSNTAPSAANEAIVRGGFARDANTLEIQIQVVGVN